MRRPLLLLLLLLAPGAVAVGEDAATPTVEQTVADVLAAVEGTDPEPLRALAARDLPDPWLVTDRLLARGEADAAVAFAQATPDDVPDVARLAAYVAARREQPDPTETRKALAASRAAVARRDVAGALTAADAVPPDPTTVPGIELMVHRALALFFLGRNEESDRATLEASEAAEALGWLVQAAATHHNTGYYAYRRSDHARALRAYEHALRIQEKRGRRKAVAMTLHNIGNVYAGMLDHEKALSYYERALEERLAIGDDEGAAGTLIDLAHLHGSRGNHEKALAYYERGLKRARNAGNQVWIANALEGIGTVHDEQGDPAAALEHFMQSLTIRKTLGDELHVASSVHNLGNAYRALGEARRAIEMYTEALRLRKALGNREGVAQTLRGLGVAQADIEAWDDAMASFEEALTLHATTGNRGGVTLLMEDIAAVHYERGEYEKALAMLERVLTLHDRMGFEKGRVSVLGAIGRAQRALANPTAAVEALTRSVREARRLRLPALLSRNAITLAAVYLETGDNEQALALSKEAMASASAGIADLARVEGKAAREERAGLFDLGTLAAARLDLPAEALAFLESGRASDLRESLAGREALRAVVIPDALRLEEEQARIAVHRAMGAYARARSGGRRIQILREKRVALQAARADLLRVAARVRRRAVRAAGVVTPRAATLARIQATLASHEVLVLYGLCVEDALAVVVTPSTARIVPLGSVAGVTAACEALGEPDPLKDPSAALARVRRLLVEPLALGTSVSEVLVSPEGPLCALPFGWLFDRAVAVTPSGSVHVLLHERGEAQGEGVLAVGDPDFRGAEAGSLAVFTRRGRLPQLPSTRVEAERIGDVVLLGAEASEENLAATLATRPRWRGLHLATHGLLDVEQPLLSSLALAATGTDDGLLTGLEILGMDIPADLVALSAARTARGRIVASEGVVGLTHCLLSIGVPRVVGSLWSVDDEATRALMVRFFELWNPESGPGLGAAEALRQAQQHVRESEPWAHPFYWAGWVVWGLPH